MVRPRHGWKNIIVICEQVVDSNEFSGGLLMLRQARRLGVLIVMAVESTVCCSVKIYISVGFYHITRRHISEETNLQGNAVSGGEFLHQLDEIQLLKMAFAPWN
jgi:hypothetical protein